MALLDRFRTQSRHKNPDAAVRLAFVQEIPLEERELLTEIAREDADPRVRRAAVAKVMDPAALAAVAKDDADEHVRSQAIAMLRDIALEAFEGLGEAESGAAVDALVDAKTLVGIAKNAPRESIALRALTRITDHHVLGSIARHAEQESVRRSAFDRLTDHGEILSVALNSEFKDPTVAAVERITDRGELEQIASRAKNKSASKRARGILRETDERAAQEVAAAAQLAEDAVRDSAQLADAAARAAAEWAAAKAAEPDPAAVERAARAAAERQATDERVRAEAAERSREHDAAAERRREEQAEAERARAGADADAARKESARRNARLAELADEAVKAAPLEDLPAVRRQFNVIRREWNSLAAAGAADPEIAVRYAEAEAAFTARDTAAHEDDQRARREALTRLQQLVGRIEPVVARANLPPDAAAASGTPELSLKTGERALKDIRTALGTIPQLPSKRDYDEIVRRLKAAQTALMPKVQELRVVADWQRWANVGIQEQLCEKMEALKAVEDPEEIARQVRDLQQQWRQAADVPRAQGEALWRRFKAAHDDAWTRCEAYFAAQNEARAGNLAQKLALIERAEALAESTNWIQTADEIKKLQTEWKTISAVSHGQEKAIWERFRATCDRFFTRRHADLADRKAMWAENLAKKIALSVKVEALRDSTDWDATASEIKRLQVEWKTIGPVKKTRSEAIWQRFRGACDEFFARYAQRHDIARGERLAAREAIVAELEGLAGPPVVSPQPSVVSAQSSVDSPESSVLSPESSVPSPESSVVSPESSGDSPQSSIDSPQSPAVGAGLPPSHEASVDRRSLGGGGQTGPDIPESSVPSPESPVPTPAPAELIAQVRSLRGRWQAELAARGVERDRAAALDERFAAAFKRVLERYPEVFGGTDLDPDANRKRMEALVHRMEDLARSLVGPASGDGDAALSPTTKLAAMLKEALAANTIGGKVDDDSRFRAANEEMRQAQAGWSRIGPVPDEARRALADRFQRAIKRITDAAGKVGSAVTAGGPGGSGRPGGPGRPGGAR